MATSSRPGDSGVKDEIRQLELTLEKTESRVRFLEDENASLREQLHSHDRDGGRPLATEYRSKYDKQVEREKALKEELQRAEKRARQAEKEVERHLSDIQKLEEENQSLQIEVEEKSRLLLRERQIRDSAASSKGKDGEKGNQRAELIIALAENEDLRNQLAALHSEMESLVEAAQQLDADLRAKQTEVEEMKERGHKYMQEIAELKAHQEESDREEKRLHDEILKLDEREHNHREALERLTRDHGQRVALLEDTITQQKSSISLLEKEVEHLRSSSDVSSLLKKIEELETARTLDKKALMSTQTELDKTLADLETMWELGEQFEQRLQEAVEKAAGEEKKKNEELVKKLEQAQEKLNEQRKLISDYELKLAMEEKERREAEAWNAAYEKKAGLEDVVRYQKKLKADIRRRDEDIRKLNMKLGEQMDASSLLYSTCQRLKQELGRPPDFQYDDLELKTEYNGELGAAQALNQQLLAQIDDLEEERLRLLKALRLNAKHLGATGMKDFGLLPEQMVLVNEFIDNLKEGRADLRPAPLSLYSREKEQELQELRTQLAVANRRIEDLEALRDEDEVLRPIHQLAEPPASLMRNLDPPSPALTAPTTTASTTPKMNRQKSSVEKEKNGAGAEGQSPNVVNSLRNDDRDAVIALLKKELGQMTDAFRLANSSDSSQEAIMTLLKETQNALEKRTIEIEHLKEDNAVLRERLRISASDVGALSSAFPTSSARGKHASDKDSEIFSTTAAPPSPSQRPSSPAAKEILKQKKDVALLPPDDWAQEVSSLHSQLLTCLEEMAKGERREKEYEAAISLYESRLRLIDDQHHELYKDFTAKKKVRSRSLVLNSLLYFERGEKRRTLEELLKETQEKLEESRIRLSRLEILASTLETGNDAELRNLTRELTRKLAVLEVNECVLARKYNLLSEEVGQERVVRTQLESDFQDMERTLKLRIRVLESWKIRAHHRLEFLSAMCDRSVLKTDFNRIERELKEVKQKCLIAIESEAQIRSEWILCRDLPRENQQLKHEFAILKADLETAKRNSTSSSPLSSYQPNAALVSSMAREELLQELSKARGAAAQLEIELAGTKKKAEILTDRVKELEAEVEHQRQKLKDVEGKNDTYKAILEKNVQKAREILDAYEGGATGDQVNLMQERIQELEKEYNKALAELERLKEVSDIALSQSQALEARKQQRDMEFEHLRERLRELEAKSDDDAMIGRLHRKILSMKVNYQSFARKYEVVRSNLRRQELRVRLLEAQLDEREKEIESLRGESRIKIEILEKALREMHRGEDETGKVVTISQLELLSKRVKELAAEIERKEEERRKAVDARVETEKKLDVSTCEAETLKLQLADFNRFLAAKENSSITAKTSTRRLLELSEDLKRHKIEHLRQQREIGNLRDEKRQLLEQKEKLEEEVRRLEEELISGQHLGKGEEQDEDHAALKPVNPMVQEILRNIGVPGLSSSLPDSQNSANSLQKKTDINPAEDPDESALRLGETSGAADKQQFGSLLSSLTSYEARTLLPFLSDPESALQKLKEASSREEEKEREILELKKMCYELRSELEEAHTRSSQQMRTYEMQLEKAGIMPMRSPSSPTASGPPSPTSPLHRKVLNYFQEDQHQLQRAAAATISSLKNLVEEKNKMIEEYQQKIEELRRRHAAEKEIDQAEIERLNEKLFLENTESIAKLREALKKLERGDDGERTLAGVKVNENLLQQLEEAHKGMLEREEQVQAVEDELRKALVMKDKAEERAGEALEKIQLLRQELKDAKSEVREAKEEAEAAKSDRRMEKMLLALKNQVTSKEKKLSGLRETVLRLKEEFIQAEERHEEEKAQTGKEARSQNLDRQVELEDMVEKLNKQLESLKKRSEKLQESQSKLKDELTEVRRKEASALKEKEELRAIVEKIQKRNNDLLAAEARSEISRLKSTLEEALMRENELKDRVNSLKKKLNAVSADYGKHEHGEEAQDRGDTDLFRDRTRDSRDKLSESSESRTGAEGKSHPVTSLEQRRKRIAEAAERRQKTGTSLPSRPPVRSGDEIAGARANDSARHFWEAEKKLKKRIDSLTSRLEEKTIELAEANNELSRTKEALSRSNKEVEALKKKLGEKEGAKKRDLSLLLDIESLQKRVVELERENLALKREIEVDNASEIVSLRHEVSVLERENKELGEHLAELRARLRRKESYNSSDSEDEAPNSTQDRLRARLQEKGEQMKALEAAMLEKDTNLMELRFEAEGRVLHIERLERRVGELESMIEDFKALVSSGGAGGRGSKGEPEAKSRRRGSAVTQEKGKREQDLETLVGALRRVIDNLKAENERLRRSGTANTKSSESTKKIKELQTALQNSERERADLSSQLLSKQEAGRKLSQAQEVISSLRRQLEDKDKEATEAALKLKALQQGLGEGAAEPATVERLRREILRLKEELEKVKKRTEQTEEITSSTKAIAKLHQEIDKLQREKMELKEENKKLTRELSAFDLEFFEEIEDLKFRYAECVRRNEELERQLQGK